MNNRAQAPLFATINVTTACNLDCSYCFMQPLSGLHMTRSDFTRVIDELAEAEVFFVNISGGEPFMHPEITDFLRIAHRRFRHVMVLSNGTLLKAPHVAVIEETLRSKGAFSIQVSLDAIDPEINAQTRSHSAAIVRNIATLSALGAHIVVATVVTRWNVDHVLELIRTLSRHTRFFHVMTVQDVRSTDGVGERHEVPHRQEEALWRRIHELAERESLVVNTPLCYEGSRGCATGAACMAAFSHLVVDPTLEVRPCDRLTDVVIGDLREQTLLEVWNSPTVRPILESPGPYCRSGKGVEALPAVPLAAGA